MAAAHEEINGNSTTVVDFEDGKIWLPSHVLSETFDTKDFPTAHQHQRRFPVPLIDDQFSQGTQRSIAKPGWRSSRNKQRFPSNRASGEPGMQAIFLSSGQRSCGTGFFLPRRIGDDLQASNKPVCSTVLLPARVVQALNLNVHALRSQLNQRDTLHKGNFTKYNSVNDSFNSISSKDCEAKQNNMSPLCCAFSKSWSSSPEIFLPKDWSY